MTVTPLPWRAPGDQFAELAGHPHCVWLDTVTPGPDQHCSIIAAEPSHVFRFKATPGHHTDPFDRLDQLLAQYKPAAAIGYFGYDLKNLIEELPATAKDDLHLPDCWFGFYDNILKFDHQEHRLFQVGAPCVRPAASSKSHPSKGAHSAPLRSNFTRDQYRAAIRHAKDYIAAGDIYQVNLSQRFQCGINVPPLELYHALRAANPAPYCAYLDIGDAQVLSS